MEGIVKFFNEPKGWGFVTANNGEELFFHFSSICKEGYKTIFQDQKVSYEIGKNSKGKCAINIKLLEE